jgi:hypothetical protein
VGESERRIKAGPLNEAQWSPFGWLPVADTDPRDGEHRLEFAWGDVHVNIIGHARAEVAAVAGGLRCDVLYRHDTHTQAIMSLDHRAVIGVAPADEDFSSPERWRSIAAFLLEPLEPLVLHRGTWHWGPFPVDAEAVRLFNVQGLRYPEDNASIDLDALGLSVDVLAD